ncbi:MAG: hypothetical protein J7M05_02005, partial [Anaerolineae bacterium]|nr:hypothetical protein [Anaerolineae bacterium]
MHSGPLWGGREPPLDKPLSCAAGGQSAEAWWLLKRLPESTVCGPEVIATAEVQISEERYTFAQKALLTHNYVSPWLIAGPFPNDGQGFTTSYPPEKGIDPQAVMQGRDGPIHWELYEVLDCFGYVDMNMLLHR